MSTARIDAIPHWALMFRQWLRHPRRTASLMPSGVELAAAMIDQLPAGTRRVIELGGGTGAFTGHLLAHGIAAPDLLVLELDVALHRRLQKRFPGIRVVHADAVDLQAIAADHGFDGADKADAIVSGLGILAMPKPLQRDIYAAAFACLRDDGRLVQFTYGPQAPLADEVAQTLGLEATRAAFVLRNLPPATVYVYRRRDAGTST